MRRYSLAVAGLVVVAGKAFGLALTSEDIALTLGFLSVAIGTSNWKAVAETRAGKPPAEATP
jgi:hypothetical protein